MNAILTSGVLAAGMLLGQTSDVPPGGPRYVPAQQTMQPAQQPSRPILNWFSREDRPIITKIQSWFKRDLCDTQKDGPFIQPASRGGVTRETMQPPLLKPVPSTTPPASNDFFRKLPNPSNQSKTPGQTVEPEVLKGNLQQTANSKTAKTPIRKMFVNRIGHDEKFEWITGQLEMENGAYVLYYATPDTIDKYNGRIVLSPQKVDMRQLRTGDLISVRGQVSQRQTVQGVTATYRLTSAGMIERP